jgi:hypothetical protein
MDYHGLAGQKEDGMKKRVTTHTRAADKTQTSIAIKTKVLELVKARAKRENRSFGNMVETILIRAMDESEAAPNAGHSQSTHAIARTA